MRPSIEQIEAKVKEIWPDAEKVAVKETTYGTVLIELSAMYQAPGRSLTQLISLSEFLGTTDIEEASSWGFPGCDSCDYGSKYGVDLEVTFNEKEQPCSTTTEKNR